MAFPLIAAVAWSAVVLGVKFEVPPVARASMVGDRVRWFPLMPSHPVRERVCACLYVGLLYCRRAGDGVGVGAVITVGEVGVGELADSPIICAGCSSPIHESTRRVFAGVVAGETILPLTGLMLGI